MAFFSRLDLLISPNSASSLKNPNPASVPFMKPHYPQPSADRDPSLTFAIKHRNPKPNAAVYSSGSMKSLGSSEIFRGEFGGAKDDDDEDEDDGDNRLFDVVVARRSWGSLGEGGEEGAFGELARAITMFAEVYERMERSKQQQMMELERQRMEFARDLELQLMQLFMDA